MNRAKKIILGLFVFNLVLAIFYFMVFKQFQVFLPSIAFVYPLINLLLTPAYKAGLKLYGSEYRYKIISWLFKEEINKDNIDIFFKRQSYAVAIVYSLGVTFIAFFMPFVKAGQNLSFYEMLPMLIPLVLITIFVIPVMLFICRNYKKFID
jgi:hypothetical protein